MVLILHGQHGSTWCLTWKAKINLNLFKYFIQNDVSSQSLDLKRYSCFPLCIYWDWWNVNMNTFMIKINKKLRLTWALFRTTSCWQATFVLALYHCSGDTVSLRWLKYTICCSSILETKWQSLLFVLIQFHVTVAFLYSYRLMTIVLNIQWLFHCAGYKMSHSGARMDSFKLLLQYAP